VSAHADYLDPDRFAGTDEPELRPAIWVADLAAYNAGHSHGKWIRLHPAMTLEELQAKVAVILDEGTQKFGEETCSLEHEEFAIHDFEGFGPIRLGEYDSLEQILGHVERMGEDPGRYFAYVDACGSDYADQYRPEDVFGPYDSEDDYAWQDLENHCGDWQEWLEARLPEPYRWAVKFDPEAYVFALRCNTSLTFGRWDNKTYAVEAR